MPSLRQRRRRSTPSAMSAMCVEPTRSTRDITLTQRKKQVRLRRMSSGESGESCVKAAAHTRHVSSQQPRAITRGKHARVHRLPRRRTRGRGGGEGGVRWGQGHSQRLYSRRVGGTNDKNKSDTPAKTVTPYTIPHAKNFFRFYPYSPPLHDKDSREKVSIVVHQINVRHIHQNPAKEILVYVNSIEQAFKKNGWAEPTKNAIAEYSEDISAHFNTDITEEKVKEFLTTTHNLLALIFYSDNPNRTLTATNYENLYDTRKDSLMSTLKKHTLHSDTGKEYLGKNINDTFRKNANTKEDQKEMLRACQALIRTLKTAYSADPTNNIDYSLFQSRAERVHDCIRSIAKLPKKDLPKALLTRHQRLHLRIAQQRQMLMLLVGDVPGDMFVHPDTGLHRSTEHIEGAMNKLLEDYQMSHTWVGVNFQNAYKWLKQIKSAGNRILYMLGWAMASLLLLAFMVMTFKLFVTNATTVKVSYVVWTQILSKLLWVVETALWVAVTVVTRLSGGGVGSSSTLMGVKAYVAGLRKCVNTMTQPSANHQLVTTIFQSGLLFVMVYWSQALNVDCGRNRRMWAMAVPFQKTYDYLRLSMLCKYLADVEPGYFGETVVSGISKSQYGEMVRCQGIHKELDERVKNITKAELDYLFVYFNAEANKAKNQVRTKLYSVLHAGKWTAMTQSDTIRMADFRKELLDPDKGFSHEIRAHHLYDHNGVPRKRLDITKAYFSDVWRQRKFAKQYKMQTIPYDNSGWYKLFHPDLRNAGAKRGSILTGIFAWNPVQEAFKAGVSKDKQKLRPGVGSLASPSADHDAHIADYEKDKDKYASAEIDLAKVLLNDNMQSWMCTEYLRSSAEGELLREQFTQYLHSGWTHKMASNVRGTITRTFKVDTLDIVYEDFMGLQMEVSKTVTPTMGMLKPSGYHRTVSRFTEMEENMLEDCRRGYMKMASGISEDEVKLAKALVFGRVWESDERSNNVTIGTSNYTEGMTSSTLQYQPGAAVLTKGDGNCGLYVLLQIVVERYDTTYVYQWMKGAKPFITQAVKNLFTLEHNGLDGSYANTGYIKFDIHTHLNPFKAFLNTDLNSSIKKKGYTTWGIYNGATNVYTGDATTHISAWCNPEMIAHVSHLFGIPITLQVEYSTGSRSTETFGQDFWNSHSSDILPPTTTRAPAELRIRVNERYSGHFEYVAVSTLKSTVNNMLSIVSASED